MHKNATREDAFEVRTAKNGECDFERKATNGQVVGQSEMYKSESGCKNGMESVMKNAADSEVVEEA